MAINPDNLTYINADLIKSGTACITVVADGHELTLPVLSKDMLKVVDGNIYSDVAEDSIKPNTPCIMVAQGDRHIMLPMFWTEFFGTKDDPEVSGTHTLWLWGSFFGKKIPTKLDDRQWQSIALGYAGENLVLDAEGKLYGLDNSLKLHSLDSEVIKQNTWSYIEYDGEGDYYAIDSSGVLYAITAYDVFSEIIVEQVEVAASNRWRCISAAVGTYLAIDTEGFLWAWGSNGYGQLGLGDRNARSEPVKVGEKIWKQVRTTGYNTFGIDADGYLYAWGYNSAGQLGTNLGLISDYIMSPAPIGEKTWKYVTAATLNNDNMCYAMAIDEYDLLFAWGYNSAGQFGIKDLSWDLHTSPIKVGDSACKYVSAGGGTSPCSMFIDNDGYLWACGSNANYLLGNNGATTEYREFQKVGSSKWKQVFAGDKTAAAIGL